jgi:hypothetical protein
MPGAGIRRKHAAALRRKTGRRVVKCRLQMGMGKEVSSY